MDMSQSKLYFSVHLKDQWATPDKLFKQLDDEFRFTLDPCCVPSTAKCSKYFTPDEDGLTQDWSGQTVFCNPPYSRGNIDKWMKKCYEESLKGCTIVCLVPASTSSRWFHNYVLNKAEIRFVKGRIKFIGAEQSAPFSNIIVIYNQNPELL